MQLPMNRQIMLQSSRRFGTAGSPCWMMRRRTLTPLGGWSWLTPNMITVLLENCFTILTVLVTLNKNLFWYDKGHFPIGDTLRLCRFIRGDIENSLDALMMAYDITLVGTRHTADADAWALKEAILKMVEPKTGDPVKYLFAFFEPWVYLRTPGGPELKLTIKFNNGIPKIV